MLWKRSREGLVGGDEREDGHEEGYEKEEEERVGAMGSWREGTESSVSGSGRDRDKGGADTDPYRLLFKNGAARLERWTLND